MHTHNEVLLSGKKNEFFPFATVWMDLEGVMLSEIEKNKYHMIPLMCESKNQNNK